VLAAVFFNLVMVNGDDFSHSQIDALRHLLGQFLV
jgi:hypothetical protein